MRQRTLVRCGLNLANSAPPHTGPSYVTDGQCLSAAGQNIIGQASRCVSWSLKRGIAGLRAARNRRQTVAPPVMIAVIINRLRFSGIQIETAGKVGMKIKTVVGLEIRNKTEHGSEIRNKSTQEIN
ncbi:hypothetical protein EVAR_23450_1 [Eumeta japonica]|uniref:Uncharacterized protein n=1 Tax=Eumeta variegata TaxID=151549 RepID=A0A4C1UKK6_EUMVA|nr:hypothetical protein EVAR_23450_1 [Eumeta japonica]